MDAITSGIIVMAFFLGGIVYIMLSSHASRRKLKADLEKRFGSAPEEDVEFESVSVP